MKRAGHLIARIADPENIRLAFWKAARGKRDRPEVRDFADHLGEEIELMRQALLDGAYPVGRFHKFTVHDPKEREIHAAVFPERVLHHSILNVCEPIFERLAIFDTYACRKGKGQWAAVRRAERFASQYTFFLKLDIRKYFDSIPHQRLKYFLEQHFKDRMVLFWFEKLLDSFETAPGRGLPIGSLTSQHLGNFYLSPLDRYAKEELKLRGYVRYMDDIAGWAESADQAKEAPDRITAFSEGDLLLKVKESPYINRTSHGMDFLGCRIFPGYSALNRRSRRRFAAKLRRYERKMETGVWSEETLQKNAMALLGFVRQTSSWKFRRKVIGQIGQRLNGLEPREPRRQLEQRWPELPVREPQQQRPGQPQQQPRFPGRPSSDQSRMAKGTEPAVVQTEANSVLRQMTTEELPGASRQIQSVENSGQEYGPGARTLERGHWSADILVRKGQRERAGAKTSHSPRGRYGAICIAIGAEMSAWGLGADRSADIGARTFLSAFLGVGLNG